MASQHVSDALRSQNNLGIPVTQAEVYLPDRPSEIYTKARDATADASFFGVLYPLSLKKKHGHFFGLRLLPSLHPLVKIISVRCGMRLPRVQ